MVCLGLLVYTLTAFALGRTVPGWTSLFTGIVFIGAVQLVCVGLLGEYVGRIYTAVQNRPTYFVRHDTAATVPAPGPAPGPAPAPPTRSPNRTKWDRAGGDAGVAHLF